MSEINLDDVLAAQDEADGEPHKVIWAGQTFTVPRVNNWPSETIDMLNQARLTDVLALLLGDQWDAFWQAKHPTVGTVKVLLEELAVAEGHEGLGGFLASSPSSNRTTRRSKPTSSASTKRIS